MASPQTVLLQAAADGSLPSAQWPTTLQYILDRLDEIVHEFPKPPAAPTPADAPDDPAAASQPSATDKENAPPATPPRPPPVPVFAAPEADALPPATTTFYAAIRHALATNFATHPPHTIQRLAELLLEPKRRYHYLSPYLRALDRVVSVSSPLTVFPLPQAVLPNAGGLLNGTSSAPTPQTPTLGSDESLGGALLTPIPWLHSRGQNELISESTEMVDGPNGAGRIETVTVGMLSGQQPARPDPAAAAPPVAQIASSHPDGETLPSTGPVTQGELLRQEQQAGIVLNNPHALTTTSTTSPTRASFADPDSQNTVLETVEAEEEAADDADAPHARGPETIGMEDTGPQKLRAELDIEGAVGRPSLEHAGRSPGPAAADAKDEEMGGAGGQDGGQDEDEIEDDEAAEEQLKTEGAGQGKGEGEGESADTAESADVEMK